MNKKQRHQKIIDYLASVAEITIPELVELTGASIATIRRDLLILHGNGALIRTPGGARSAVNQSLVLRTFNQRRSHNAQSKLAIAAAAKRLIKPGMTIVIDSGTTCWQLATLLTDIRPLRVLTSAVAVLEALGDCEGVELIMAGGIFRRHNLDFIGPMPLEVFGRFQADIAFLGCDGFSAEKGIYTYDVNSQAISRAIAGCAALRVVLMDHDKLGKRCSWQILALDEIDYLITDTPNLELPRGSRCVCIHAG